MKKRPPTLRIASACESHFTLPSFSVIDPKSRKSCVITILDTDEDPVPLGKALDPVYGDRSKVAETGEVRLWEGPAGEKVWLRARLPLALVPPPACDAVVEAALGATKTDCDAGVMALDLGDARGAVLCACCDPLCRGGKLEMDGDASDEVFRK